MSLIKQGNITSVSAFNPFIKLVILFCPEVTQMCNYCDDFEGMLDLTPEEKKKGERKPTKSPKKKTGGATKKAKSTPKKFKLLKPATTPVSKLKLTLTKIASKSKKAAAKEDPCQLPYSRLR